MSEPTIEDAIARALFDHLGRELRGLEVSHEVVTVKTTNLTIDVTIKTTSRSNSTGETSAERGSRFAVEKVAADKAEAAIDKMVGPKGY